MTFLLFISLVSVFTIGYCAVGILWPDRCTGPDIAILKFCTAIGIGFGITSLMFFTASLLWGTASGNYFILEGMTLVLFIVPFIYKFRRSDRKEHPGPAPDFTGSLKTHPLISVIFTALCVVAVLRFMLMTLEMPHGGWDAWAVWNMRARFLARGGAFWTDAFSPVLGWSHPDYPLLAPISIARLWRYDTETLLAPAIFALLYTVATVFLLFTSLSVLRSRAEGILASAVLLGVQFYIGHGASQQADVPLAFYFLVSIVLLSLHDHCSGHNKAFLFLAGMTAGFSAWTKNEGVLFVVAIAASRFFISLRQKRTREHLKEMFQFGGGLIPVLAVLPYFKARLAPPNDLINVSQLRWISAKLADYSRYMETGRACLDILLNSEWVYASIFFIGYFLICGVKREERRPEVFIFIALFIMAAGYCLSYVITPKEISWHVETSFSRLLLQLWPVFVFAFFMWASPQGKALTDSSACKDNAEYV